MTEPSKNISSCSISSLDNLMNFPQQKEKIENLFISSILLLCCYKADINKNYKFHLSSKKIIEYLKSDDIDDDVIKYIEKNFISKLEGKVNYLRNTADSECMCLQTKENIYLVFCGTQFYLSDICSLIKDLYTDLSLGLEELCFLKNKPSIKIHSKYQENMLNEKLIDRICKIIKKSKSDSVNISGHSMGCGLALYTSLYLSKKIPHKLYNLFTLDAPKLGNCGLNKYVRKNKNIRHFDMINGNDFVPLYPFIYPNYEHVYNNIILIDKYGNAKKTKKFSRNLFTSHSVSDHYNANILQNLYKILNTSNE